MTCLPPPLELFQKFIRFGTAILPLDKHKTLAPSQPTCCFYSGLGKRTTPGKIVTLSWIHLCGPRVWSLNWHLAVVIEAVDDKKDKEVIGKKIIFYLQI